MEICVGTAQLLQVDVLPQLQKPCIILLQVVQAQILITLDTAHYFVFVQACQQVDHLPGVGGGAPLEGRLHGKLFPHGQRLQPFPQPCLLLRPAGEL